MKKILSLFTILLSIIFLSSCSSNNNKESESYSDDNFIKSLSKGLDARWEIAENTSDDDTDYAKLVQTELDEVENYKDEKFEDDKLKELAISYINELKDGKEVGKAVGADNFIVSWYDHQNKRTEILNKINKIKKIPVKDTSKLEELLAQGKSVEESNNRDTEVDNLLKTVSLVKNDTESNEYSQTYDAIVDNTLDFSFKNLSIDVTLLDESGVNVGTSYISINNWQSGTKAKFEFTTDKTFSKIELVRNYYEAQ